MHQKSGKTRDSALALVFRATTVAAQAFLTYKPISESVLPVLLGIDAAVTIFPTILIIILCPKWMLVGMIASLLSYIAIAFYFYHRTPDMMADKAIGHHKRYTEPHERMVQYLESIAIRW